MAWYISHIPRKIWIFSRKWQSGTSPLSTPAHPAKVRGDLQYRSRVSGSNTRGRLAGNPGVILSCPRNRVSLTVGRCEYRVHPRAGADTMRALYMLAKAYTTTTWVCLAIQRVASACKAAWGPRFSVVRAAGTRSRTRGQRVHVQGRAGTPELRAVSPRLWVHLLVSGTVYPTK